MQSPHASLEQLGHQQKNQYSLPSLKVSPRKPAPDFRKVNAVLDEQFIKLSRSDYRKWRILVFCPFNFTFVCPTGIMSFHDRTNLFRSINAEAVAVSTNSHHTHLACWPPTSACTSQRHTVRSSRTRTTRCTALRGLFVTDHRQSAGAGTAVGHELPAWTAVEDQDEARCNEVGDPTGGPASRQAEDKELRGLPQG